MSPETPPNDEWQVHDDGRMTFYTNDELLYEIEPENLGNPEVVYQTALFEEFDPDLFFVKLIQACRKAGIEELKLILKK